jgi:hypothetical protein
MLMITNRKLCRCNLNIDLKSGKEPKLMPKRSDVDTCLSELLLYGMHYGVTLPITSMNSRKLQELS